MALDAETLDAVLETLRAVADRELDRDERLRLDAADEFPAELMAELLGPNVGLHLLFLPDDNGGLGGGAYDTFRLSEEIAHIDLGVGTAFLAIALGLDPVKVAGTEQQRERWFRTVAEQGWIVAYGVTEPQAGSNVAAMRSTAEPVTDEAGTVTGYRLNGVKQFITNGGVARLYTILARAPGGPSFFLVERGTPGLSSGPHEEKMGIRSSNTCQVILEDVVVPADQLLGLVEGRGLEQANEVFGYTRLMVAACGLGAGEEAVARAVAYGREREQFGGLLVEKQGFTHKLLVPHAVRLQAARAYCEHVARRFDEGEHGLQVEGSVAKLFATEAGKAAADAAIQAHGGYGYTKEYEVEKIWRDVRITTIYEGTSEIQQNIIGMFRWRSTVKSKGGFYRDMAVALREAHGPGSERAARAADALAETVLAAHRKKLPKQQIVMFELARLMTEVETAVQLCLKVASCPDDPLLASCARLHADDAARDVAFTGLEILAGCDRHSAEELAEWRAIVGFPGLVTPYSARLADLDRVAAWLVENG